jgi:hypothetical protein
MGRLLGGVHTLKACVINNYLSRTHSPEPRPECLLPVREFTWIPQVSSHPVIHFSNFTDNSQWRERNKPRLCGEIRRPSTSVKQMRLGYQLEARGIWIRKRMDLWLRKNLSMGMWSKYLRQTHARKLARCSF